MPRSRSAFSSLKKTLRATNGVAAPGSEAAKYADWVQGKTKKNKQKPDAQRVKGDEKNRMAYSVLPFSATVAAPGAAADRYVTGSSIYSLKQATNIVTGDADAVPNDPLIPSVLTKADLGAVEVAPANIVNTGFYAAQIIIRAATSTGTTGGEPARSGITGRAYRYKTSATATLSFGKSADGATQSAVFAVIKAKVGAPTGNVTRSFGLNPEIFKTLRVGASIT